MRTALHRGVAIFVAIALGAGAANAAPLRIPRWRPSAPEWRPPLPEWRPPKLPRWEPGKPYRDPLDFARPDFLPSPKPPKPIEIEIAPGEKIELYPWKKLDTLWKKPADWVGSQSIFEKQAPIAAGPPGKTSANGSDAALFAVVPTSEGAFEKVFAGKLTLKKFEEVGMQSLATDLSRAPSLETRILMREAGPEHLDSFVAKAQSPVLYVLGHNEGGQFIFPNGGRRKIADIAKDCAKAGKHCIFVSCGSSLFVTGHHALGVPIDLSYGDGIRLIHELMPRIDHLVRQGSVLNAELLGEELAAALTKVTHYRATGSLSFHNTAWSPKTWSTKAKVGAGSVVGLTLVAAVYFWPDDKKKAKETAPPSPVN